jgi:hypothetical protein
MFPVVHLQLLPTPTCHCRFFVQHWCVTKFFTIIGASLIGLIGLKNLK